MARYKTSRLATLPRRPLQSSWKHKSVTLVKKKDSWVVNIRKWSFRILFIASFGILYYVLFWGIWWKPQGIQMIDYRGSRLNEPQEVFQDYLSNMKWYQLWRRPDHIVFINSTTLTKKILERIGEAHEVNVKKNILQGILTIEVSPLIPKVIAEVVVRGEGKETIPARFFALSESGEIRAQEDTLRYNNQWVEVPRLKIFLPREMKLSDTQSILYNSSQINKISDKKNLELFHSESNRPSNIPLDIFTQSLDEHPLWIAFSQNDTALKPWQWPTTGLQMLSPEYISALIEIRNALKVLPEIRRVTHFELEWPQPDRLAVRLVSGGSLIFSLSQPADWQISSLLQAIEKTPDWYSRLDYIDVRFGDRVYIKKH